MGEYLNYEGALDAMDVKSDHIPDGANENQIKAQAKDYLKQRIKDGISPVEFKELFTQVKALLARQYIEKINLKETLRQNIYTQSKESLSIEKLIQETKMTLYEKLGINFDLGKNTDIKKFVKGLVDGLIINNIETLKQVIEMGIEQFVDSVKELLSVSGILEFFKSIKEEITDLPNILQKPYEGGTIIGGYGLGIFGKGLKGLSFLRKAEKVESKIPQAVEKNLSDVLDQKGFYSLGKIDNLSVLNAKKLLERFATSIDIKYLVNHPNRINDMLESISSITDYIDKNASQILKMNKQDFDDFKKAYSQIGTEIGRLIRDKEFAPDAKYRAQKLLNEKVVPASNKIIFITPK